MSQTNGAPKPMKPAEFHILLVLSGRDLHGLGIAQAIDEASDGVIRLGPGTLYRTLKEMQDHGLIEQSSRRPAPDLDDERRRYYRLTKFGKLVAAAEAQRMASLVSVAQAGDLLSDSERA